MAAKGAWPQRFHVAAKEAKARGWEGLRKVSRGGRGEGRGEGPIQKGSPVEQGGGWDGARGWPQPHAPSPKPNPQNVGPVSPPHRHPPAPPMKQHGKVERREGGGRGL